MPRLRRLAAIMFTDMVGSTALAQRDEALALAVGEEHRKLVRPIFRRHHGREVKSLGDGFLVEFSSALEALECGVQIQREAREHNLTHPPERAVRLRVGIHLGDVVESKGDISGDAVNVASRIQPLAEEGGVTLSEQVHAQVRNKVSYPLEPLGARALKGVREPTSVYRVVLPWSTVGDVREAARPGPPRLAVLPLANISPDPADEYFADGLTEELISVLSQLQGLRVIARTSVGQYKATSKPIAQIGGELGVATVLEGSVRKAGDQLRITMQLVDVSTEEHLWAQSYDRRLENVFAIQREVAERTAEALKLQLGSQDREAIARQPTQNLAAYGLFLQAIHAYRTYTRVDFERAGQLLDQAIREDPNFAAACSYRAHLLLGAAGALSPGREVFPRARELVARALALDPDSSDAHSAKGNLAMQADLDWSLAEEEFRRALELKPSDAFARYWYGLLLRTLQRFDESERELRAAIDLEPHRLAYLDSLMYTHFASARLDQALALAEELVRRAPAFAYPRVNLGIVYYLRGRTDDAKAIARNLPSPATFHDRFGRALLLAWLGDASEARSVLEDWEQGRLQEYAAGTWIAGLYAVLGEREKALALLEREDRAGERGLWFNYLTPYFDPIRGDPRFVALVRGMNLSPDRRSASGG